MANAGTFLFWFFLTPAAATLALFAVSWLIAPTRRHLRRSTVELTARRLLLPAIGMVVVTVGLMRLTNGWWPLVIAMVSASVGELAYEKAQAGLAYDLQHVDDDSGPRSADYRKRVIRDWLCSTGRGSTAVSPVAVVIAALRVDVLAAVLACAHTLPFVGAALLPPWRPRGRRRRGRRLTTAGTAPTFL